MIFIYRLKKRRRVRQKQDGNKKETTYPFETKISTQNLKVLR